MRYLNSMNLSCKKRLSKKLNHLKISKVHRYRGKQMNLEEIQAKISENAIKATEILEAEDGDIITAQKMLDENEELQKKLK